jgi:hypothetical protein
MTTGWRARCRGKPCPPRPSSSAGDRAERLEKLDARIDQEDIESDIGRIADSAIIARLLKARGLCPISIEQQLIAARTKEAATGLRAWGVGRERSLPT